MLSHLMENKLLSAEFEKDQCKGPEMREVNETKLTRPSVDYDSSQGKMKY